MKNAFLVGLCSRADVLPITLPIPITLATYQSTKSVENCCKDGCVCRVMIWRMRWFWIKRPWNVDSLTAPSIEDGSVVMHVMLIF